MAERAREESWDYEDYLAAVLHEEVASREDHGGENRVKAARFPQVKTLDDFDFSFQRSVKRRQISHLAQLDFLAEAHNVVFLGPPGTGKTHLSIALGVQAARPGHRVAFATAHEWVLRLGAAKRAGRLEAELEHLGRIQLVIVDEVGYIPFDPEAGALFFALISSRYERRSLVVNSNKTFSAWAEIFGDPVAVTAMVDRLVHHAEVIVLRGDSYRLKGKGKEVLQPEGLREVSRFQPAPTVQLSTGVDRARPQSRFRRCWARVDHDDARRGVTNRTPAGSRRAVRERVTVSGAGCRGCGRAGAPA